MYYQVPVDETVAVMACAPRLSIQTCRDEKRCAYVILSNESTNEPVEFVQTTVCEHVRLLSDRNMSHIVSVGKMNIARYI